MLNYYFFNLVIPNNNLVAGNSMQYNVKAAYCTKATDSCIAEKVTKIIRFPKLDKIVSG